MTKIPEIFLYNTMTKQKEPFKPKVPGKVGMYVCGVTAYDFSHIGHARAYVAFDILFRYLRDLGYEVTYVRNFTDVDDKIIKRANEVGEDPLSLSDRYCKEFLRDMSDLNCLSPTEQPRVSAHMDQIRDMITQIIEKDCAYIVDGDVYFSVDKFPGYGKLSGRKAEDNRAGERVAVDSRKRNPADFALWKAAKPGEPSWESPWGLGRPGWHIECSAMSAHYLTTSFDIHGGGQDLIFPHHENELAQSCAACKEANISYWLHNGFVTVNDEKMSKSLGNFFTIREVTKLYHPLALRYFLMGLHYRSPVNYSIEQIELASDAVYYIHETMQACDDAVTRFQQENSHEKTESNSKTPRITATAQGCIKKLKSDFQSKMSDDLHASDLLTGSLKEALRVINNSVTMIKKIPQQIEKEMVKQQKEEERMQRIQTLERQKLALLPSLIALEKETKAVLDVLGLLPDYYSKVLEQLKEKALVRAGLTEADVLSLIEERTMARSKSDFETSDRIRKDLFAKGISLMDEGGSTTWKPCIAKVDSPAP
ncbi:hypothetical protein Dimus_014683 [Dionaea muscipula]